MKKYLWGLGGVLVLALLAMFIAPHLGHAVSPLLLAIVVGIVIGNTVYPRWAPHLGAGVGFAKARLLRAAIVLFGFHLTWAQILALGWPVLVLDVLMVSLTFSLAVVLGQRVLGLDRDTAMLIGAGSSICGAAAVLAVEPVLKAPAHKVSVAVATVVLFGTLSMLLYPLLYSLHCLPFTPQTFGVYVGASVHEVAQVVAAAGVVSQEVANTAVFTKMTRVVLLAPFLFALSWALSRGGGRGRQALHLPWFALGFLAVIALNSLHLLSAGLTAVALKIDTLLLTMAMAALGLTTRFRDLVHVGAAPFALALGLFLWLVLGGGILTWLFLGGA